MPGKAVGVEEVKDDSIVLVQGQEATSDDGLLVD